MTLMKQKLIMYIYRWYDIVNLAANVVITFPEKICGLAVISANHSGKVVLVK